MPDPPSSSADPSSSTEDSWLDRGWPLTRFLGYRPPPPPRHQQPTTAAHRTAEKVLPAPLRERHREKRAGGDSQDGLRDDGEEGGGGAKGDKEGPSLRRKAGEKLWDMFLTMLGCFGGVAFVSLSASSLRLVPPPSLSRLRHRLTVILQRLQPLVLQPFQAVTHRSSSARSAPRPSSSTPRTRRPSRSLCAPSRSFTPPSQP